MSKVPRVELLLCLVVFCSALNAKDSKKFVISANYPGVGIKYQFLPKNYIEARFQFSSNEKSRTNLYGIRYYHYYPKSLFHYYLGGEISYFNYNYDNNYANGSIFGMFAGLEKFFSKKISFNMDIGPFIGMGSSGNISVTEFDFVLNASVNFYFGK